jgi:hypothetical protein
MPHTFWHARHHPRIAGQDCILRAGFQPALVELFTSDSGGLPVRRTQAWNQFANRTRGSVAAEGYGQAHADARSEGVPFQPEPIDSAVQLGRARPDKSWSLNDCLPVNRRLEFEQSPETG